MENIFQILNVCMKIFSNMVFSFVQCFRFGIHLIFIYGQIVSTNSLELNTLLNLFEYCTIHIYNYRGLTLSVPNRPVTLYLKTPFQIEPEISNFEIIRPVQCQAAIYIMPTDVDKPGKDRKKPSRPYSRLVT